MISIYRLPDYRHQVIEISPPVPTDGETTVALERCAAAVDAVIRAHPAEWDMWYNLDDLLRMGLVPDAPTQAATTRAVMPVPGREPRPRSRYKGGRPC
jgi:hypothetical protein